jgi:hypothetical protein
MYVSQPKNVLAPRAMWEGRIFALYLAVVTVNALDTVPTLRAAWTEVPAVAAEVTRTCTVWPLLMLPGAVVKAPPPML